jgi:ComF family protein
MFDALLSHVAPHPCYSCGKIGSILCDNCKYDISQEYFEGCFICGNEASLTRQCSRCSTPYSRSWCIGTRSGALRQIIDSYKFYNNYDAHRTLASLLSERIGYLAGDVVIVPLPTVPSHIRVRGYDHTLLLAKRLAKLQNLRLQKSLYRQTSTTQRGEDRNTRQAQAKAAFSVKGRLDSNTTYLLIDDVVTTGATLKYGARALKKAGAGDVWVAALAYQPLD